MDISLIKSQSLVRLLALTEKKEELLRTVAQIDAFIIETLRGGVSVETIKYVSAPATPTVAPTSESKISVVKPAKKRKLSAAGRARIAAAMKARWEAHRAGKAPAPTASKKADKPSKKA
jgi:hypothetical protein